MTTVRAVELRMVGIPLVRPFRTSFGVETRKVCVLVARRDRGRRGLGGVRGEPGPRLLRGVQRGRLAGPSGVPVAGAVRGRGHHERAARPRAGRGPREPHGEGDGDRRVHRRRAPGGGALARRAPGRRHGPRGVRRVRGHHGHDRAAPAAGGRLPDGWVPAHQVEDRAGDGRGTGWRRSGRAPRHRALRRRERRVHARRRGRLPSARPVRPAHDRTTSASGRSDRTREAPVADPDRHLPGRVDPISRRCRRRRSSWGPVGS